MAQTIRPFLLVSTTTASFFDLRASAASSHGWVRRGFGGGDHRGRPDHKQEPQVLVAGAADPAELLPPGVETSRGVMPIQDRAGLGERPNVHRALGRGGRGLTNYCKKGISHGDMVIYFFDAEVKAELDALPVEMRANFERIVQLVHAVGL
jgi:hypothetical protein